MIYDDVYIYDVYDGIPIFNIQKVRWFWWLPIFLRSMSVPRSSTSQNGAYYPILLGGIWIEGLGNYEYYSCVTYEYDFFLRSVQIDDIGNIDDGSI